MRWVVIVPTLAAGKAEATALGLDVVAICTPRSPARARGIIADRIFEATGLTDAQRDRLLTEVAPCFIG